MKKTIKIVAVAMVAVMLMLALVSCGAKPNSDPEKAKEALKDNGYIVANISAFGIADCKENISATKIDGESKEAVTIFYFENSDAADAAYDQIKKLADEDKDSSEDVVFGQSGSMIYFGTKAAIKAAS